MKRLIHLMTLAALASVLLSPVGATADDSTDDSAEVNRWKMNRVSAAVRKGNFAEAIAQSAEFNACEFGLGASADPTTFVYLTNLAIASRSQTVRPSSPSARPDA